VWCVFFKPYTKLTLHCNHRSEHLKTECTESLLPLLHHLGNWSRGLAVSIRSELLVALEKPGQFPLLTVYVVTVYGEKLIFNTFETASFFYVCPALSSHLVLLLRFAQSHHNYVLTPIGRSI
jgi:hypothetical protein